MDGNQSTSTMLVCTSTAEGATPTVVLADGSYETGTERVFWRYNPDAEVLRVPLGTAVSTRAVYHPSDLIPRQRDGQAELLAAVAADRAPKRRQTGLRHRLARTLAAGQVAVAEAVATVVWRQHGLDAAHRDLATCLAETGDGLHGGSVTALEAHRATKTAQSVLERLHSATTAAGGPGRVVLAVPAGDPHTLALTALAHQLQEAGFRSLVVDDLPSLELGALAARHDTVAVVISAHVPWSGAAARRTLRALRTTAPDVLVVLGGPGAPAMVPGCDLVTNDPTQLLQALHSRGSLLTPREYQVLQAVADGRSNSEIAAELAVSAGTVKTHLEHVFAKTETTHRAAAVARALRQGWIT